MKTLVALCSLFFIALPVSSTVLSEAEFSALAQQKAQLLGQQLKQSLLQAVKAQGLANGVNVCKDIAPAIAMSLSKDGWQVERTALKVRNPANTADAWEQQSLQAMLAALAKGESPTALTTVSHDATTGQYRYMQPIMTGKLCINCHGSALDAKVVEALAENYPNDQATGFDVGELRGAFSISYQPPE